MKSNTRRKMSPEKRRRLRKHRRMMRRIRFVCACVGAAIVILLALILFLYFSAEPKSDSAPVHQPTASPVPMFTPQPTYIPHITAEPAPATAEPEATGVPMPVIYATVEPGQPTPEPGTTAEPIPVVYATAEVPVEIEIPDIIPAEPIEATPRIISASSEGTAWIVDGRLNLAGEEVAGIDVSAWENLVEVALGEKHVVAIDASGRAWAAGDNSAGQCDIDGLEGVVSVSASTNGTIAVLADGTVRAFGAMKDEWLDGIALETGVVQADMSSNVLILLKEDGTARVFGGAGIDDSWQDLRMVAAGYEYCAGLTGSGEVLVSGVASNILQETLKWRGMRYICAGIGHLAGIRSDGSVVAVGRDTSGQLSVQEWAGMIAIDAGYDHTVGIDAGGAAHACGYAGNGQCDVH